MKNQKILILAADNYEDLELHYPKLRLLEAEKQVVVAGEKKGNTYKSKHGYEVKAAASFDDIAVNDFAGIIIPGGFAPDSLRAMPKVLDIVKQFHEQKKLVAFICHGAWIPVSAKVLKGIKCTSYHTIKDDVVNAGANWVDEVVVVDKHFISSRCPDDLPKFCSEILKFLSNNS